MNSAKRLNRAVLFGGDGWGNAALEALVSTGIEPCLVLAHTDGERGEPSLEANCRERGVPVSSDPDLDDRALVERIDELGPDLLVLAGFSDRLPGRFLRDERLNLGVHPSLLPAYRGRTPSNWCLIDGEATTGVTVYELSPKAYEGDLVAQSEVSVEANDTDGTLRRRLADTAKALLAATLDDVQKGERLPTRPQDNKGITHFPPLTRRDALIKFDEPTKNVYDRIRGTTPWPGAHTFHGEREIRILAAEPLEETSFEVGAGLVMRADGDRVVVKTSDGAIRLETSPSLAEQARAGEVLTLDDSARPLAIKKTAPGKIVHTQDAYGMVPGAEEFPKMVVVATVYPCNAKCPNCPYTETNSDIRMKYQDQPFIDEALFKKIADECGEYGSFVRITGGGEPMMHPSDMVSLIEYAKEVGAKVWLNTNGSLMSHEKIDRLLASGLDQIEFSVDAGDPDTYTVVRAGLDWDGLIESVSYMVRERNRRQSETNIVVSVIEQEHVQGKMDEIAEFWLELGVDEVMRRKFLTWGSNTSLDAVNSADPTPYLDKTEGEPCPYPFHRLNVDSRGKVEVCGYDIAGRTNFGNLREQTIREIWKGPMFEWWRQMHLDRRGGAIPLCRECPDWQYRSWTHNWEKVMRTAEEHRLHAIELTDVSTKGETGSP